MVDWLRITGFEWDDGNVRKNADKHDVSAKEAEEAFFNQPLLVLDDDRHSISERRFHALGMTHARRYLHITFCLRQGNTKIRIISARPMSRKERKVYDALAQDSRLRR